LLSILGFKNVLGVLVAACRSANSIFLFARLPLSDGGLTPATDTGKRLTA